MYNYIFEVTGTGRFPSELLAAGFWPASKEDASVMLSDGHKRTITLHGRVRPNKDVWRTYGWSCFSNEIFNKDDYDLYHTWPC